MMTRHEFSLILFLFTLLIARVSSECSDVSYSDTEIVFPQLKRITRIAVLGQISAFYVQTSMGDAPPRNVQTSTGKNMVLYSSLSNIPSWQHIDLLVNLVRIISVYKDNKKHQPALVMTVCDYDSRMLSLSDSPFSVDVSKTALVAMYENELTVQFRTFRSGLFFFSLSDHGDVLIAQIIQGTIQVIFDFGSLSPSKISGGRALDDGEWHEMRWVHQFDSVQLSIDGVLLNQTTPTGLYRKLDLHSQVHVAGRPPDEFSPNVESSFHGCLARMALNGVDLLAHAPSDFDAPCQMARPPAISLHPGASAWVPFSFLPFSFEFRTLPTPSILLHLLDTKNGTLLKITLEDGKTLQLISNFTKFKQISHPAISVADGGWHGLSLRIRGSRLEVDIDGFTVLWLEGSEVRRISVHLSSLVIASPGCYRSTTLDFATVRTEGKVERMKCAMIDRCLPNPCANGGECSQISLTEYTCDCPKGYSGTNCFTSEHYRSCEEWFFFRDRKLKKSEPMNAKLRNVTVDIDGGSKLRSFMMQCKRDVESNGGNVVITTMLSHDLINPVIVSGEQKPGAVKRGLDYGLAQEEMDALVEGFDECQQWMSYSCRGGARLMTYNDERTPSSWYATRSDKHALQWGEAPPYSRMCSCAVNSTCIHNRMCNCDSGEDGVDVGWNPFPQLLPVTALYLGGTSSTSAVNVSIGPLICRNKMVFESVTFSSKNARLSGSSRPPTDHFSLLLHIRFTHSLLSIFTWESVDGLHWFQLYIKGGQLIGEIVNGGETVTLSTKEAFNDGKWHSIYWEADSLGMRLSVDGSTVHYKGLILLPNVHQWTFGSREGKGLTGFAGVLRNIYLCGEEIVLGNSARKAPVKGVEIGEGGSCQPGFCHNGGLCVDGFDSHRCDCSLTPFGGHDCTKEYGMWVPLNSSLEIPWQNPNQQDLCHRMAIQTASSNISLIHGRSLFSAARFNLSMSGKGHLSVIGWDGFMFTHRKSDRSVVVNDERLHDITLCANKSGLKMSVDGLPLITLDGNWTFFETLNVWEILDKNFTGCVSRLRVGNSFPLKNAKASRLKHTGNIRFGTCPVNSLEVSQEEPTSTPFDEISISSVVRSRAAVISLTSIGGACLGGVLLLTLCVLVCWMRSRPEGVYKTNEGVEQYSGSGSRSEEPLVQSTLSNKEYFC